MTVQCERAGPLGGQGTTAVTWLTGTAMEKVPSSSVQNSAVAPGRGPMSAHCAELAGVNTSGGTTSSCASVQ